MRPSSMLLCLRCKFTECDTHADKHTTEIWLLGNDSLPTGRARVLASSKACGICCAGLTFTQGSRPVTRGYPSVQTNMQHSDVCHPIQRP